MSRRERSQADAPEGLDRELDSFYESLYLRHWARPNLALMLASVPSVMMWDDHDIFDGWGSYPDDLQGCDVYAAIYRAASRYFEQLQLRSRSNTSLLGVDRGHYSFGLSFRGHQILGLDNRSGRTLDTVMSGNNWADVKTWLVARAKASTSLLVMSAVPVVYRSFARAEAIMGATPWHEELEDDVFDHWSAKRHEGERLKLILNLLAFKKDAREQGRVVILSGDVHVGSLGLIVDKPGPGRQRYLHQVVSSGIVHPSPSWMQWQGVRATSSDEEESLERGEITTENIEPLGGEKFIRTRNYATLELGTDDKLWVEWVCEDGRRREYGISNS